MMKTAMILFALSVGCGAAAEFRGGRIARVPEGITPRLLRFSTDGKTVAYIGRDNRDRERVIVNEREGRVYDIV